MTNPTNLVQVVLAIAAIAGPLLGQMEDLSLDEKEHFLLTAKVTGTETLSEGVTGSIRATLSNEAYEHDAHVQSVDVYKRVFTSQLGTELGFRDSYLYNIAAYRLARILEVDMVPPSVERTVSGTRAAVTWWVDDVLMSERERYYSKETPPNLAHWWAQIDIVRVFDQLIYNTDRNLGNLVIDERWNVWMIDHTRAFRIRHDLRAVENLLRCDRRLLSSLRSLDRATLIKELKPFLNNAEIMALLARRDRIVAAFEEKIKGSDASSVLYDFLPARP